MTMQTQTHNRHLDGVRQALTAHPTQITEHDLDCARRLLDNAHQHLREVYKLLKPDTVLRIQAETAGQAIRRAGEAVAARMPVQGVH